MAGRLSGTYRLASHDKRDGIPNPSDPRGTRPVIIQAVGNRSPKVMVSCSVVRPVFSFRQMLLPWRGVTAAAMQRVSPNALIDPLSITETLKSGSISAGFV